MNVQNIFIFENKRVDNLYPFSVMHNTWEVRCGALRLFEKLEKCLPGAKLIFNGRNAQLEAFLGREGIENNKIEKANTLIIDASVAMTRSIWDRMKIAYEEYCSAEQASYTYAFTGGGIPFAVYMPAEEILNPGEKDYDFFAALLNNLSGALPQTEIEGVSKIEYLWDAIYNNGNAISADSVFFDSKVSAEELPKNVHTILEDNIIIGEDFSVAPGVVLDASEGPIVIGNNVKIMPHAVITGPCYIGDNTLIKIGAKIYEDNSFGPCCKIGGEVENSIFHAYSNKQHDGFIGHSYIGEWVNFGADTNNSDLKNTYGDITVNLNGRLINTGKMFLGLLLGDHSKSGINSMFTTGTVAGICGILLGDGFMPNAIPSFSWGGKKNSPVYRPDKAIGVARKVMARRNRELLPSEEALIRAEYDRITAKEKK